jgi:hypothetical protein
MNATITLDRIDPAHLKIRIGDDQAGQYVIATATEIEALILELANFRAQIPPEVSRTVDNSRQGLVDPVWVALSPREAPDKLVSFRHDGIGWLPFLFHRASARSLADYLQAGPTAPDDRRRSLH